MREKGLLPRSLPISRSYGGVLGEPLLSRLRATNTCPARSIAAAEVPGLVVTEERTGHRHTTA
jgi:hypothetical protein